MPKQKKNSIIFFFLIENHTMVDFYMLHHLDLSPIYLNIKYFIAKKNYIYTLRQRVHFVAKCSS
jgi:hypothetical protein